MSYTFNASALGFGGVINPAAGDRKVFFSQASVALAPTGGEGFSEVTNYRNGEVSFDRAYTHVVGFEENGIFTTVSEVSLSGLNLFGGMVRVGEVSATVTSVREVLPNTPPNRQPDSQFSFSAQFNGLNVIGQPFHPSVSTAVFDEDRTYAGFIGRLQGLEDPQLLKHAVRFGWEERNALNCQNTRRLLSASATPSADLVPPTLRCTVVEDNLPTAQLENDNVLRKRGYTLHIPRLGKIHLGELLMKPGRRRLTLLRIDYDENQTLGTESEVPTRKSGSAGVVTDVQPLTLATPAGGGGTGSLSFGSVDGNGTPAWP